MTLTLAIYSRRCGSCFPGPPPVSRSLPFFRSRPLSGKLFKRRVYRCIQFICGELRNPFLALKARDFVGCFGPAIYSQTGSLAICLVGCPEGMKQRCLHTRSYPLLGA